MSLPHVIYRLVTDEAFRDQMKADPRAALAAAGLSLSEAELNALTNVSWDTAAGPTTGTWWGSQLNPSPTQPI